MVEVNRIAAEVRERWGRGESPNLAALLAANPDLRASRSIFLDLAHEEFCRRVAAGERLDTDEYCRQYPSFQSSLCMLIEVNRLLGRDPRCQSARSEFVWPKPGELFLGYFLIAEIGRGSFARVFTASEAALGDRPVVLKIAPHGGAEAEMAGRLQHPNIVPIHSIKEDPTTGLTAICMPYLGRATLCDVLDRGFAAGTPPADSRVIADIIGELRDGPLDVLAVSHVDRALCRGPYVEGILRLAVQIADALTYTHARGICHRDLKPSNVLLSVEGRPLLLDFNLSVDGKTSARQIGGTLPYMAPEYLTSVAHELQGPVPPPDPRSDIFSLGVIIYQLLCGRLPFGPIPQGESIEEVAAKLLERHRVGPEPLREHNRQVDRSLAKCVEDCLAFDPESRPRSTGDLAGAIRRQLGVSRRTDRWVRNHPRHMLAGAVVMVGCVVAGSAYLALRDPESLRQLKQGLHYAEHHEYQLAAQCLDKSIEAKPDDPQAFFARGRVRQMLGFHDLAAMDFYDARKIMPRAELHACQGFCASKLGQHGKARLRYHSALESGFRTPSLLNNLGHACIQLNRYDEAEQYLNEAIRLRPRLQAAQNNLVLLHVRRAVAGETVTEPMLTQAKRAIEAAKPSGELFYLAATLFGRAARTDSRWVDSAKEYVRLAVANHMDARVITSDPGLSGLLGDEEVQVLRDRSATPGKVVKPVSLVDPLEGNVLIPCLDRSTQ